MRDSCRTILAIFGVALTTLFCGLTLFSLWFIFTPMAWLIAIVAFVIWRHGA